MTAALARVVLEEMDIAVLVIAKNMEVRMANRAALQQLRDSPFLRIVDGHLSANGHPTAQNELFRAISDAVRQGTQRLVVLRHATCAELSASIVPLVGADGVLLSLGRATLCSELTLMGYASATGLTLSESDVLSALCKGDSPEQIALARGVKLSTVRTQLGGLRVKTNSSDLRDVILKVGKLPTLPIRLCSSPTS